MSRVEGLGLGASGLGVLGLGFSVKYFLHSQVATPDVEPVILIARSCQNNHGSGFRVRAWGSVFL